MGKIYVIMGKSASGKDTVYREVAGRMSSLLPVVLYTTRPVRDGEEDGVAYHFTDEETIRRADREGKLIESRTYDTVYGPWIYATIDDGQIDLSRGSYLVPGTLESFLKLRDYFGRDNVIPVYLEVEDGERLFRALERERRQQTPKYAEMCRRFLADQEDFSEEKLEKAGISLRFQNEQPQKCAEKILEYISGYENAGF